MPYSCSGLFVKEIKSNLYMTKRYKESNYFLITNSTLMMQRYALVSMLSSIDES